MSWLVSLGRAGTGAKHCLSPMAANGQNLTKQRNDAKSGWRSSADLLGQLPTAALAQARLYQPSDRGRFSAEADVRERSERRH
jgi:hypothetical protein